MEPELSVYWYVIAAVVLLLLCVTWPPRVLY